MGYSGGEVASLMAGGEKTGPGKEGQKRLGELSLPTLGRRANRCLISTAVQIRVNAVQ